MSWFILCLIEIRLLLRREARKKMFFVLWVCMSPRNLLLSNKHEVRTVLWEEVRLMCRLLQRLHQILKENLLPSVTAGDCFVLRMLRSYRNSSSENQDKGWKVHTTSFSSNCSFLRAEQMSEPRSLLLWCLRIHSGVTLCLLEDTELVDSLYLFPTVTSPKRLLLAHSSSCLQTWSTF